MQNLSVPAAGPDYGGCHVTGVYVKEDSNRLAVLKPGRVFHPLFKGHLFCLTGYRPSHSPPSHPV
eukprot:8720756-Karenia_brevis.AAC.1